MTIQIQPGMLQPGQIPPQLLAQMLAGQPQQLMLPLPGLIQQQQFWQGPYPPPDALERYERVLPGTFDRLIGMAERLQQAQIDQSKMGIEAQHAYIRRGHWLGFATTGMAMAGTVVCAAIHEPWVAGLFLSVPVLAVARALIESRRAPTAKDLIPIAQAQQQAPHQAEVAPGHTAAPSQPK